MFLTGIMKLLERMGPGKELAIGGCEGPYEGHKYVLVL